VSAVTRIEPCPSISETCPVTWLSHLVSRPDRTRGSRRRAGPCVPVPVTCAAHCVPGPVASPTWPPVAGLLSSMLTCVDGRSIRSRFETSDLRPDESTTKSDCSNREQAPSSST
jgi:hypothetical protein